MRLRPPITPKLQDAAAEQVRRNHAERITEIQAVPIVGGRLIRDVELPDAVDVQVPHNLGHRATVFVSPPRGGASNTGRITDRTEILNHDRSKVVTLRASGWVVTLIVDLWVF